MRYRVIAVPSAENALADFWMSATDRNALSAAANRIDAALKDDPETKGVFCEGLYILRDFPLVAVYEVVADDCLVRIVSFGLVRKIPANGEKTSD